MATRLTTSTFSTTYKDDYDKTKNFYRILFNSGRAIQARELTQLQTIIQEELGRFGRNIFKEGAAVNPGGITLNTTYEFIKIESSTPFPSDSSILVDTEFTGQTSGIKVKVLEAVDASGSDPDTLYVMYTDTTSGTPGTSPIRMTPGENISNGSYTFTVQSTNTVSNPAVGVGTKVSIEEGDFFTQGHFVYSNKQSKIISKYTNNPTVDVGFRVDQEIVTVSDDTSLYDNQGATPNLSAPGADRYRIKLTIATRDELDSSQTFLYVAKIKNGLIVDEVSGLNDYAKINDLLALRTKEESGNYNVKPFTIKFSPDSDTTVLRLDISDGVSYINGYRAARDYPTTLKVSKAQDTVVVNNEVVAASYGNYVIGTGGYGARNINDFQQLNIMSATGYGGSVIGTCRVRAVEQNGSNFSYSLFEIKMNSGQSFRSARSIGTSSTDYFDLILENGQAVLKQSGGSLLFDLPKTRPSSIADISLTVQRRFITTTDSSGSATLTLTASGETFSNTNEWFLSNEDSAYYTGATITGAGTTSATISNGPALSTNLEVLTYINKSAGASRTKTLTETTVTKPIESDGTGLKYVDLTVADIYSVSKITDTDSNGENIAHKFTLDNGQRDNYYDLGKLVLNGGQTAPAGNVFVRFKYFTHGASGDFFSVNSYSGQVAYDKIPSYRKNNGEVVSLRDVLDFRSVKNSTKTFSGGAARINELPKDTDLITLDVTYYQPRYSKLIIDKDSKLSVISGPSSLSPVLPPVPENALELYNIKLNPYTLNDSDLTIEKIETRRYTMADIGKLEDRIDNLEEMTALSLLELDTANFDVLDSSGINRTKSGFVVDNFKDHFFSDIDNVEYRASVDPDNKILRPAFNVENIELKYDSSLSTNTIVKGDNVYLKYDHNLKINQVLATGTENINPFGVITNEGTITLSPSSDNWSETRGRAGRAINNPNSRLSNVLLQNWNNWEWNWTGRDQSFENTETEQVVRSPTRAVSQSPRRTSILASESVRRIVGNRAVDITLIPFMRSVKVYFKAEGLRPNTRMFAFFDGVDVSSWVRQETFQNVSSAVQNFGNRFNRATQHPDGPTTLTTDAQGKVEGSFFIPNTNAIRFRTGTREFKLLDISVDKESDATSFAKTVFTSIGVLDNRRPPRRPSRQVDPLAQSFFVDDKDGIFLTKVDVFFATKDTTIPVELQIRPMVNGSPSSELLVPGASKFLAPASITTSSDASVATTFEFDEPIYLEPYTEYAIVLKAETTKYSVYVAETYQFLLGSTEKRVTKQPTMGSLFKSQNGSTWEPDQTKDLTFRLYNANFTVTSGSAILENVSVPRKLLDQNPITVDSGSSTVTITHPNHGFQVADTVNILGVDSSSTIGGIKGTSILGDRTITKIDWTGYTITADSSGTSNEIGGGTSVTATQNHLYDIFVPNIELLVPTSTNASLAGKFTTGKSFAGTETPYQKDASYSDIYLNRNNILESPRLVANDALETTNLGAGVKSTTIKVDLSTTSSTVSPVVDLQRSSMFLINNLIDKQDSSATSGFNVPISFVNETDPSSGSMASKHLIKPVTLEKDAVGLKVIVSANRPSVADFEVYYRTGTDETVLSDVSWQKASLESSVPSDENPGIFRDYEYLIGGQGGNLSPFVQFQIKIVFRSTSSSKVPVIRDLRIIALAV